MQIELHGKLGFIQFFLHFAVVPSRGRHELAEYDVSPTEDSPAPLVTRSADATFLNVAGRANTRQVENRPRTRYNSRTPIVRINVKNDFYAANPCESIG